MFLFYKIDKDQWNSEYEWLHSILPWTGSKRDWHWRVDDVNKKYSIRISNPDKEIELLLRLSRSAKISHSEYFK